MDGGKQLKALIWRDTSLTCGGCPEDVQKLVNGTSSYNITSTFVGPDETLNFDSNNLFKDVDIVVLPGGPDLDSAWEKLQPYNDVMRDFVANGGRYIGICLGAFLAGPENGFNLLSLGNDVSREVLEPGCQAGYDNINNSVVQVDWTFQTGSKASSKQEEWVFFQDGSAMGVANKTSTKVLGRYVSNNNVSATLQPFGKGWVGLIGFHPEADNTWYESPKLVNPDGINFDIGHDFISAVLDGGSKINAEANSSSAMPSSLANSITDSTAHVMPTVTLLFIVFSWLFRVA